MKQEDDLVPDELVAYISSTLSDLREYRQAVRDVLRQIGVQVIALEDFTVREAPPVETCASAVSQADVVVLVLAWRYGYVPKGESKSIVEIEFEVADNIGKPILPFVVSDEFPWPPLLIDLGDSAQALARFKQLVKSTLTVTTFTTADDLAAKLALNISNALGIVAPTEAITPHRRDVTLSAVMQELKTLRLEISALQAFVQTVPTIHGYEQSETITGIQPAEFLGASALPIKYNRCFVIMPYSEKWSIGLEKLLGEICRDTGLEFTIAKSMNGRFIPHDVWKGITGSGIIIADLSGGNPNVAYEVGLADVLGREVVLLAQNAKVPFDFLGQRLVLYEDSFAGMISLREELSSRISQYMRQHSELKSEKP